MAQGIEEQLQQLLVTKRKFILSSMSIASLYCIHELVNNFCWVIKNTWWKRMGEKVIGCSSLRLSVIENIIAIKQLILSKLCLFLVVNENTTNAMQFHICLQLIDITLVVARSWMKCYYSFQNTTLFGIHFLNQIIIVTLFAKVSHTIIIFLPFSKTKQQTN